MDIFVVVGSKHTGVQSQEVRFKKKNLMKESFMFARFMSIQPWALLCHGPNWYMHTHPFWDSGLLYGSILAILCQFYAVLISIDL